MKYQILVVFMAAPWASCSSERIAAPLPAAPAASSSPCAAACTETGAGYNEVICYSCRCKEALGELPTPEELRCSDGEEIEVYRNGAKVTTDVEDCENPAMLYVAKGAAACRPGSRILQFTKGPSTFKMICRRYAWHPRWDRPTDDSMYEDMGIIGHNPATGATCFWDDLDDGRAHDGNAIADIDLTIDSAARARAFAGMWITTNGAGETCLQCHDSDPFVRTNYLKSLRAFPNPSRRPESPYALVLPSGDVMLGSTGLSHLTGEAVSECTSCHRIGLNETCRRFAPDALGSKSPIEPHVRPYQASARDVLWMPPFDVASPETRDHIMGCCGQDSACETSPIPGPF